MGQLSLIAAVTSHGGSWLTVNKGINNTHTFLLFILKLIQVLDNQHKNWRQHTVLLLDNAPIHRSA